MMQTPWINLAPVTAPGSVLIVHECHFVCDTIEVVTH